MFDFFGWLKRRTTESIIAGFEDAAKAVAPGDDAPTDLDGLRARIAASAGAKQLAAPVADDADEPPARKPRAR